MNVLPTSWLVPWVQLRHLTAKHLAISILCPYYSDVHVWLSPNF